MMKHMCHNEITEDAACGRTTKLQYHPTKYIWLGDTFKTVSYDKITMFGKNVGISLY